METKHNTSTQTVNIEINKLCDEIDYWKAEAKYWKKQCEEVRAENVKRLNEDIEKSKQNIANVLMLALSVEDQPDGSLNINKKNREKIYSNLTKEK